MLETEVKAVVPDPDALRQRLLEAGARAGAAGRMSDIRVDRTEELAGRDEVLRVRVLPQEDGTPTSELTWKGPVRVSPEGFKEREERTLPVQGTGDEILTFLARLGYAPVLRIDRHVEYLDLAGVSVRLEWYPRMDVLVEVEGDPARLEEAIAVTGLPRDQFSAAALDDFVARWEQRTGEPAVLALAELSAAVLPDWPEVR